MKNATLNHIFWSGVGSFLGISVVALITTAYKVPLLAPSFGASAVLLYAACHVPMAQPRNVIGGHILSAILGVSIYSFFGTHWWSIALGVALAIMGMILTDTLHPPGGATAFIAVFTGQDLGFIFTPIAIGAIILTFIAYITNNLAKERRYPERTRQPEQSE